MIHFAGLKAVGESDSLTLRKVRGDVVIVHFSLTLIVNKYHDNIRFLSSLGYGIYLKAILLGDRPGFSAFFKTYDYFAARITKVKGMGMAL